MTEQVDAPCTRRATVMGLGLFGGGVGAARHLAARGYAVTATDLRDETVLARSVAEIADLDVRLRLGGHDGADFTATDLVVVNPAVRPDAAFLRMARDAGVPIDTEIAMFVRECAGRIVGVTGTAGKSTTTALLGECLHGAALRRGGRVLVGGNIGVSLLPQISAITERDLVVLELSSFQLHWLREAGLRPALGVVTNVSPNHLDWHDTAESYAHDKAGVIPAPPGTLVASRDDAGARALASGAAGRVVWTARDGADSAEPTVSWVGADLLDRREPGSDGRVVLSRDDVRLLGDHARSNVASAAAAALLCGAEPDEIRHAVGAFDGLPHRLRPIGDVRGVLCVDDSKSTTPAATASALAAFSHDPRPLVLLAGGYDKGLDPAPLAAAARGARAVVCFGATGPALAAVIEEAGVRVKRAETLGEAVPAGLAALPDGGVLVLSPGHASWDQFDNYIERARVFAEALGLTPILER